MIVQILLALAWGACYAPLPATAVDVSQSVGAHSVRPSSTDLAKQFEHDIKIVAADDMEGRGLGTKGIDRAAAFLENRLRELKLKPAFGKSYKQPFEVKTGVEMGEGNRLSDVAADAWTPLGFSSSGKFAAPVVFVGYGIAAPPLGYDDYAGVDLQGKIALMLRYEPQEKDDKSVFDGRKPSRWSVMRYKVLQARQRGAVAVIFTTGPQQDEGKDRIPALKNDGPQSPAGIPVIQVKPSVVETWGVNLNYPSGPADTMEFARGGQWTDIPLRGSWFTEAFEGPMSNLQRFVAGEDRALVSPVDDAMRTMALVEACYASSAGGGTPIPPAA